MQNLHNSFQNLYGIRNVLRLQLSWLYILIDTGGLKCSNIYWYYQAAQLRTIMFYFSTNGTPAWLNIASQSFQLPLHLNLYSDKNGAGGLQDWAKKGLGKISDLYEEEIFMTFKELSLKHNIPNKHFFKFLQFRSEDIVPSSQWNWCGWTR